MELEVYRNAETVYVRVSGRVILDEWERFKAQTNPQVQPGITRVFVDMSDVEFIDSAGLGALVGLKMSANRNKAKLSILSPSQGVADILYVSKLDGIFDVITGTPAEVLRQEICQEEFQVDLSDAQAMPDPRYATPGPPPTRPSSPGMRHGTPHTPAPSYPRPQPSTPGPAPARPAPSRPGAPQPSQQQPSAPPKPGPRIVPQKPGATPSRPGGASRPGAIRPIKPGQHPPRPGTPASASGPRPAAEPAGLDDFFPPEGLEALEPSNLVGEPDFAPPIGDPGLVGGPELEEGPLPIGEEEPRSDLSDFGDLGLLDDLGPLGDELGDVPLPPEESLEESRPETSVAPAGEPKRPVTPRPGQEAGAPAFGRPMGTIDETAAVPESALQAGKARSTSEMVDAHCTKAFEFMRSGDYDRSVEEYKKALELNPDYLPAHNNLAIVYEKKPSWLKQAVDQWETVMRLSRERNDAKHVERAQKHLSSLRRMMPE